MSFFRYEGEMTNSQLNESTGCEMNVIYKVLDSQPIGNILNLEYVEYSACSDRYRYNYTYNDTIRLLTAESNYLNYRNSTACLCAHDSITTIAFRGFFSLGMR